MWAVSSAVERLVYTERVGSSILSPPTIFFDIMKFFLLIFVGIFIASCGVKSAPEHPKGSAYPRTYPAETESQQ